MAENQQPATAQPPNIDGFNDEKFRAAVARAPRAKALDGTTLIDLAFILPEYPEDLWWPLRELLAGYWPGG
jgi:hypothetical protein